MAYEYLNDMGLPGEMLDTLKKLGARTPGALLSMLEHSRDKFVRFLGDRQTTLLHDALLKIVPAEERDKLKDLPEFKPSFGAILPPKVESSENIGARDKRDQLMDEIRKLRELSAMTPENTERLETLEKQLRDVLKFTVVASRH